MKKNFILSGYCVAVLNHKFQKCTACTLADFGTLSETFSEEVLRQITGWMKEVCGR